MLGEYGKGRWICFRATFILLISHQSKTSKSALLLFNTIFLILDFEEIGFSAENQSKQEQIGLELIKWICPLLNNHHGGLRVEKLASEDNISVACGSVGGDLPHGLNADSTALPRRRL